MIIHDIPDSGPKPAKAGEGLIPMPQYGITGIDTRNVKIIIGRKGIQQLQALGYVPALNGYQFNKREGLIPHLSEDE